MNRFLAAGLLSVELMILARPGLAATLRAVVDVRGATVRLSDLFAGLDAGQDCTLGDAPQPGGRLVIEQPQLEAIALQFGVSWEPLQSAQTVTLNRPGKDLTEAAVLLMIKAKLNEKAADRDASVVLDGFATQQIDADAVVDVSAVVSDTAGDHFKAVVTARLDGRESLRETVRGSVERLVTLPVLARSLPAGDVIGERDLMTVAVPVSGVHGDVVELVGDAVGLTSSHALVPGVPLVRSDLRRPDIVQRNGAILMRLSSAGIDVAAQGQSLESGALTDRVRVLNPVSHAVLVATVIGPNEVRVDPDSLPTVPSGPFALGVPVRVAAISGASGRFVSRGGSP